MFLVSTSNTQHSVVFFFSSRRRHTRSLRDWSSDVCSSDLVAVRIERTGAERVFQRIGQERASNIFACDVAQSSDAAHYIAWKREGALAPCVPEDVARHFPEIGRASVGKECRYRRVGE